MNNQKILWQKKGCKYKIVTDGYGLGICDDWTCDRPIIYDDKRVAYDFPERLPKYIKKQFEKMALNGQIWNRMPCK